MDGEANLSKAGVYTRKELASRRLHYQKTPLAAEVRDASRRYWSQRGLMGGGQAGSAGDGHLYMRLDERVPNSLRCPFPAALGCPTFLAKHFGDLS